MNCRGQQSTEAAVHLHKCHEQGPAVTRESGRKELTTAATPCKNVNTELRP